VEKKMLSLILALVLAVFWQPLQVKAEKNVFLTEQKVWEFSAAKDTYYSYYHTHFSTGNTSIKFIDLTHDGVHEMVVMKVGSYTEKSEIFVYTYVGGRVKEIYHNEGTDYSLPGYLIVHLYRSGGKDSLLVSWSSSGGGYLNGYYEAVSFTSSGAKRILFGDSFRGEIGRGEAEAYYEKKNKRFAGTLELMCSTGPPRAITSDPKYATDTPFLDISSHWAKGSIAWAVERNLFSGISETQFGPEQKMSRGMLAAALHRLAGTPDPLESGQFEDIKSGVYYEKAASWAAENGIVSGTGAGKFSPGANITREQLAAMLYRYARQNSAAEPTGDLAQFTDRGKISAFAKDALSWAVGREIISGKGNGRLDPGGFATRAEVASILQRFAG